MVTLEGIFILMGVTMDPSQVISLELCTALRAGVPGLVGMRLLVVDQPVKKYDCVELKQDKGFQ